MNAHTAEEMQAVIDDLAERHDAQAVVVIIVTEHPTEGTSARTASAMGADADPLAVLSIAQMELGRWAVNVAHEEQQGQARLKGWIDKHVQ